MPYIMGHQRSKSKVYAPGGNQAEQNMFNRRIKSYYKAVSVSQKKTKKQKHANHTPPAVRPPPNDEPGVMRIYTDGSCTHNGSDNARAGYGVFISPNHENNAALPVLGKLQTNNRGELMAIAHAITLVLQVHPEWLNSMTKIIITSDSQYSIDCISKWAFGWAAAGWIKKSDNLPPMNCDILQYIHTLLGPKTDQLRTKIQFEYIKGHANLYGNTDADALAVAGGKLHPDDFEAHACFATLPKAPSS